MSNSVSAQPEPEQWWGHKKHTDDRAYFIGRTPDGEMVWQCRGDNVEVGNLDWSDWEHLPACTGWRWVDAWPKYYRNAPVDLGHTFVRHAKGFYEAYLADGKYETGNWNSTADQRVTRGDFVEIPAEDGLKRIATSKPEPAVVKYPEWYVPVKSTISHEHGVRIAYLRRDSEKTGETFLVNGLSYTFYSVGFQPEELYVVTEDEAKSHVNPPVAQQKFPQYVKDCCGMIFRADSPDRIFWLPLEGGEHLQDEPELHWAEWSGREPLSELEIGEIINRSIQAEELESPSDVMGQSPDDWVMLDEKYDECPLLPGYQCRMLAYANDWKTIYSRDTRCGELIKCERKDSLGEWEFRCRRADLPGVNARIPVALYWYDGAIVGRYADSPVTDPSFVPIHSDNNGGWFIERSDNAGN